MKDAELRYRVSVWSTGPCSWFWKAVPVNPEDFVDPRDGTMYFRTLHSSLNLPLCSIEEGAATARADAVKQIIDDRHRWERILATYNDGEIITSRTQPHEGGPAL